GGGFAVLYHGLLSAVADARSTGFTVVTAGGRANHYFDVPGARVEPQSSTRGRTAVEWSSHDVTGRGARASPPSRLSDSLMATLRLWTEEAKTNGPLLPVPVDVDRCASSGFFVCQSDGGIGRRGGSAGAVHSSGFFV